MNKVRQIIRRDGGLHGFIYYKLLWICAHTEKLMDNKTAAVSAADIVTVYYPLL